MKPTRLPSVCAEQTYFITTSVWQKQSLFQADNWARLVIESIYHYRKENIYLLHAFVIMPDHMHLIVTPNVGVTIERSVQYIKGGSSHRIKQESGRQFPVWQRGFTDRRVRDLEEFKKYEDYIHQNPVKAGLCKLPEEYPYSSAFPSFVLDGLTPYLSG